MATDPRQSGLMMPVQIHKVYPKDLTVQNIRCMKLQRARNSQMKGKQVWSATEANCLSEKIPPLCYLSNQYNRCHFGLLPFWICCPFHTMLIVLMDIPYLSGVKMKKIHRALGSLCKTRRDEQAFKNPIFLCSYVTARPEYTSASLFNINLCFYR